MARETLKSKLFPGVEFVLMDDFGEEDAKRISADENNTGNRPKKGNAVERYAEVMLRREWEFNGEGMIEDTHEKTLSGRNRSLALIKAEKLRKKNPAYYAEQYGLRGPVKIPMLIVKGIKPKTYRTIDGGEKRTGADMFYVAKLFNRFKLADGKQEFTDGQKKSLARILATASRTVWLRLGGKDVKDAPKFPPSAQDEFVKRHPLLVDCVAYVFRCDLGADNERLIQSLVSPAYLAAVMYLAATSKGTDREDYDAGVVDAIKDKLMPEAEAFVDSFSTGTGLEQGSPILVLRRFFTSQKQEGTTRDRDVVLNSLVKAMLLFLEEKTDLKQSDVKWKSDEAVPRLGGLDIEPEPEPEPEPTPEDADAVDNETEAVVEQAKPKRKKAKKKPTPVTAEA